MLQMQEHFCSNACGMLAGPGMASSSSQHHTRSMSSSGSLRRHFYSASSPRRHAVDTAAQCWGSDRSYGQAQRREGSVRAGSNFLLVPSFASILAAAR